jgi:hypothetical protein
MKVVGVELPATWMMETPLSGKTFSSLSPSAVRVMRLGTRLAASTRAWRVAAEESSRVA